MSKKLQINIFDDTNELYEFAYNILHDDIKNNSQITLGLATGSTPIPLYQKLIIGFQNGKIDFSKVRTINLDEYLSLLGNHPASYRYFMDNTLFNQVNIDKANTFLPNGKPENVEEEVKKYHQIILDNPMGILYDDPILGIYLNNEFANDLDNVHESFKKLKLINKQSKDYNEFNFLHEIIKMKLQLRMKLIECHERKISKASLIKGYQQLANTLADYLECFKKRWLQNYLPYGLEIHEYRIAGQIERIKTLIERIRNESDFPELDETKVINQPMSVRFIDIYSPKKDIL